MAVVAVQPIHPRRRSSWRNNQTTHSLMWLVTCDSQFDGPAAAIWADGIPRPGSAFVDNLGLVAPLSGIDVDPRGESDKHFEVQVQFTTPTPDQPDENPLDQPWGFTWSYAETTEDYFTDRSDPAGDSGTENKAVVNSSGEVFERYLQRERGELQITITRNVATHNAAALDQYSHTINKDAVNLDGTTFAAGTLKLAPIGAVKSRKTMKDQTVVVYYAQTISLKARHQGWHDKPLDVGFNELVGDPTLMNQSLRPIVDSTGMPIKKPWPLKDGAKLPNATDDPDVLDFEPYFGHLDWSPLGLV